MSSIYLLHTESGQPAQARVTDHVCDADRATWTSGCGIDTRALYHASPSRPVAFRPLHGHFEAPMHRPTRRERIAGWWRAHRWDVRQWLARAAWFMFTVGWLLLAYLAICLVMDGANALLDWAGV